MKTCSQCGNQDRPFVQNKADGTGTEIAHFVVPEIQYLKDNGEITLRQIKIGWKQRVFQGRTAIERDICMDCLNSNYIRRQLNAEQRSKALALEKDQNGDSNFYLLLADVDGAY